MNCPLIPRNHIRQGDCLEVLKGLPEGSVDQAVADPPYNIGVPYRSYKDRLPTQDYVAWCVDWLAEIKRVLAAEGTLWLVIGAPHASRIEVAAVDEVGLHLRDSAVWNFSFGQAQQTKLTQSHVRLLRFTKDPQRCTFNADAIRVPSDRQLLYNDRRANPKGKVPNDVLHYVECGWVLRPQDAPERVPTDGSVWSAPRVAGRHKQRVGQCPCQMPEQIVGLMIKASSNPGDLVLDPFAGGGTTLAVAKKLRRRWLGIELDPEYARDAERRVAGVRVGGPLEGTDPPAVRQRKPS